MSDPDDATRRPSTEEGPSPATVTEPATDAGGEDEAASGDDPAATDARGDAGTDGTTTDDRGAGGEGDGDGGPWADESTSTHDTVGGTPDGASDDGGDDGGEDDTVDAADRSPTPPSPAPGWPSAEDEDEGPSANLVAIAVDDPMLAQEGLLAAMRLVRRNHLQLEDAAIVVKESGGRIRIQETRDTRPPQGAAAGTWLGMLATLFVAPGALLIGAALGAAAGGIFAKLRDIGLQDEQMKALGEELPEGSAALLLLVEEAHLFHALAEARRFHGRVLQTTCDEQTAERLTEALSDSPWGLPG